MHLFERWQAVAKQHANAVALRDRALGRTWTFAQLAEAVGEVPRRPDFVVTRESGAKLILETLAAWRDGAVFCPLEANGPAPPIENVKNLPAGVVHVKMTSGTTGQARGVMFTASQLAADADNIVATMGLRPDWPNLGVISLTHSYGFSSLVLPLLLHAIPLDWSGDPLPGAVAAMLAPDRGADSTADDAAFASRIYTVPAVPAMWRAWHAASAFDADSIALAISAGAPLPVELEQRVLADTGLKIHNFYGSSECGGIAYDRGGEARQSREFVGQAMANVELSINADGCLEIVSEAVGEGYWPDSEENIAQLSKGRFVTSDLGELNLPVDGGAPGVTLLGRRDDLINVAGRKVSPPRVEAAIMREASVRHCVVFGVPSSEPSRVADSVAAVAPGDGFDLKALKSCLAERLQLFELPRRWWLCPALAPDSRGKISRAQWRERYLEHLTVGKDG